MGVRSVLGQCGQDAVTMCVHCGARVVLCTGSVRQGRIREGEMGGDGEAVSGEVWCSLRRLLICVCRSCACAYCGRRMRWGRFCAVRIDMDE